MTARSFLLFQPVKNTNVAKTTMATQVNKYGINLNNLSCFFALYLLIITKHNVLINKNSSAIKIFKNSNIKALPLYRLEKFFSSKPGYLLLSIIN